MNDRQIAKFRSTITKLYHEVDEWPVEYREDWITLHVSEIHSLFLIAKQEALDELFKRFDIEKPKRHLPTGRPR